MDKAKIMRLCNDIEDEVTDIAFNSTHMHIYDCCESIREYLKEIAAEITAPPKSNADRIRQMTDEEIARFLRNFDMCIVCQVKCTKEYPCNKGIMQWLKQEVNTNDER